MSNPVTQRVDVLDYLLRSDFGRAYPERARELAAQALVSQARAEARRTAALRIADTEASEASHVAQGERTQDRR